MAMALDTGDLGSLSGRTTDWQQMVADKFTPLRLNVFIRKVG